jgi:hypothetical protein
VIVISCSAATLQGSCALPHPLHSPSLSVSLSSSPSPSLRTTPSTLFLSPPPAPLSTSLPLHVIQNPLGLNCFQSPSQSLSLCLFLCHSLPLHLTEWSPFLLSCSPSLSSLPACSTHQRKISEVSSNIKNYTHTHTHTHTHTRMYSNNMYFAVFKSCFVGFRRNTQTRVHYGKIKFITAYKSSRISK